MIPEPIIEKVVFDFYQLAIKDILIGYHFRHIDDFDTHIPRIAQFWSLQINGVISEKSLLPFIFFDVHIPLKINKGEIFRWIKLFESVLDKYEKSGTLSSDQVSTWKSKIDLFSKKLTQRLFGPNSI